MIFLTLLPSLHLYNSSQSDGRLYYVSSNDEDENNDASEVDEGSSNDEDENNDASEVDEGSSNDEDENNDASEVDEGSSNDEDENNDASEVDVNTFSPNNIFGSSSEESFRDENDGGVRDPDPEVSDEDSGDLDPVGLVPNEAPSVGLDPVGSDPSLDPEVSDEDYGDLDSVKPGNGTSSADLDPVNNERTTPETDSHIGTSTSGGLDPANNERTTPETESPIGTSGGLDPVKGNTADSVGDSEQSSGKKAFASGPEEDIPKGETFQNREDPGFTHITKLIADDLKKMPIEEIKVYPWEELNDEDVERVVKYLSFDPEFLVKIISNTSEDGIIKIQNSLSLKSFNEIITNIPPEHAQKIKEKFSG